ncbi:uncharacterized protein [Nicotiana sylvestris]|uniref:uncharacterized protein n=1 Tax=Nicotiana sylvestris TaxID=4096 RepID=UPI00388CD98F
MATLDIDNPRHPLFLQPSDNSREDWERVNATVLTWIMNTVSPDLITRIVYADNAHEVWLDLEDRFNKDEHGSLIPSIPVIAGTRDFIEYLDQQKLFQFLMGLNESYRAIRSQILLQSPSPSVSCVFAILINEENQRKVCLSNSQVNLASDMNDSTAFMNTKDSPAKFRKFNNLYCEYCRFK